MYLLFSRRKLHPRASQLGNGAGGKFANARAELMLCELQLQLLGPWEMLELSYTPLYSDVPRRPSLHR